MRNLIECTVAIIRIAMGMVALVGGLIVLDLIIYITSTGNTYDDKLVAAYDDGFVAGYTQTYYSAYHKAYLEAYARGYDKEYKMRLETDSEERVATRVELINPTYKDLQQFLANDKTDDNLYIPGEYVSLEFAVDLNNNAELSGIRAAFVTVIFPQKSHGIVAFETVDKGLIFIEPQSDVEVNVDVGKSYWRSVNGFRPAYYDDTVKEIQILW